MITPHYHRLIVYIKSEMRYNKQLDVLKRIMIRERLTPKTQLHGVGAMRAGNIMLVGERASGSQRGKLTNNRPFCTLRACSGWLNGQLDVAGIPEERLYWINILDPDGIPISILPYLEQFPPSHIICLGGTALKQVARQLGASNQIPILSQTHPQYCKRFRSAEPYPLILLLKGLIAENA